MGTPRLVVVMYHYLRDVAGTAYPELKALPVDAFGAQVDQLQASYEMVSLEGALAFIEGAYRPQRDLCLLTFDDGLSDHYAVATPILAERGIAGIFNLPTACIEEGIVLPVHKNHFLMASLGFDDYQRRFMACLEDGYPSQHLEIDPAAVAATYRWDTAEVAWFKYLINYVLESNVKEDLLALLFTEVFGEEQAFARELYVGWPEVRAMQDAGMLLGGHTHTHPVLSHLEEQDARAEISRCRELMEREVAAQPLWPFAYPFGKPTSYTSQTMAYLQEYGFDCAFTTIVAAAVPKGDRYALPRFDTKDV